MLLSDFAAKYRLKVAADSCGDPIIPCQLSKDSNISDYGDTELAISWITDGNKPSRTGLWNRTKLKCLAAGMRLSQEGDSEGVFVFDPADAVQAKLAIKSVKARAKRKMTPERRAALALTLAKARCVARKACQEGLVSD
jgi:hypothetical protein